MPNERNVNELTTDELLTVLADARCSYNDASSLGQEEKRPLDGSAEPVEPVKPDREQLDLNETNKPSPPGIKARRPLRQPPVEPLSGRLLGWCSLLSMTCAMGLLFYALYLDFFQNKTTHTVITVKNIKQETLASSSLVSAPLPNAATSETREPLEEPVSSEDFAVSESIASQEPVKAPVAEVLPKVISDNDRTLKDVVRPETPIQDTPPILERKIGEIVIGDRAVGTNPLGAEPSEADATIFERVKHYGYRLRCQKPNGTYCDIALLRPADWLYSEDVRIRSESTGQVLDDLDFQLAEFFPISFLDYDDFAIEVFVALPEMGVMGWSKLVEIDENVQIQPGPGNVVTGTFAHISDEVVDLLLEDREQPIGCTANHPFWSVDRQDFVAAGQLQDCERVQLYNGDTKRIAQKLPRPGPRIVYNLEVYSEHVYQVTADGVLVHNSCLSNNMKKAGVYGEPGRVAHHIVPQFAQDENAVKARGILEKYNIGINSHWNGVYLETAKNLEISRRSVHRTTPHVGSHYNNYYKDLAKELSDAPTRAKAIIVLQKYKRGLLNGTIKLND